MKVIHKLTILIPVNVITGISMERANYVDAYVNVVYDALKRMHGILHQTN